MNWADQVTEESGTLRAQNLGAAVCADGANGLTEISVEACAQLGIPSCARKGGVADGLSITILPGSRRLTAEGGKVRPWTVDNVGRISEMAEAYVGRGGGPSDRARRCADDGGGITVRRVGSCWLCRASNGHERHESETPRNTSRPLAQAD